MLNPSSLLVSRQDTPFNVDEETPRRQPKSEKNTWRDTLLLLHVFSFFSSLSCGCTPPYFGSKLPMKTPQGLQV